MNVVFPVAVIRMAPLGGVTGTTAEFPLRFTVAVEYVPEIGVGPGVGVVVAVGVGVWVGDGVGVDVGVGVAIGVGVGVTVETGVGVGVAVGVGVGVAVGVGVGATQPDATVTESVMALFASIDSKTTLFGSTWADPPMRGFE